MKLLIAIPALNEEQSIHSTIQRCLDARQSILENSPVTDVDITVVSDGSTDHTVDRAREFGSRINLIEFQRNRGYGAAIMEAWSHSQADLLGFLDADGTCDPQFFATLCNRLVEKDADVALGCRLNSGSQMPVIRRVGNMLFAWLLSMFASETVRDTASGMRVVRRSALRHLYPLPIGLHFTPAMSARAMLSDATRIVEIDMPYAEREGESKLRVIRDGFRFLRVIVANALLYKAGRILSWSAAGCFVIGALLMLRPLIAYIGTRTVAEWMIYRFLVSSLAAQVALLLLGAGMLSGRIASIVLHEEVRDRRTPFSAWMRTGWFWSVAASLAGAGLILVWPSVVQLSRTGHTDIHWSRFVVAMGCFGSVAVFCVIRGLDRVLDLVEERVQQLWK
ncbi:MAG: glycosyltransferase family 2 protein [Acidobacteriia bacterium]|nr:glycosyltransferase family 2 protein [Terriglobia bacterium]